VAWVVIPHPYIYIDQLWGSEEILECPFTIHSSIQGAKSAAQFHILVLYMSSHPPAAVSESYYFKLLQERFKLRQQLALPTT
jgi:hypothetical protein